ncbi:hypothetical protein C5B96_14050 [Subtercola sp. Z020]|uniref:hypothetical protein n=1 Tax=Subtercola sp. Z020 TaxID=2080582 RepID=UPI000CE8676C|nr:hypothetical protein [Subtercola sp. Z020]PPF78851.1 hypothetical protein C5B96_14050 [Subtercola sp. Z020]
MTDEQARGTGSGTGAGSADHDTDEPIVGFDQTNGLVEGLEGDDGGAQNDDTTASGGVPGRLLADIEDGLQGNSAYDTVRGDADSDRDADGRSGADGYVEPVDDGTESGYSEEGRP